MQQLDMLRKLTDEKVPIPNLPGGQNVFNHELNMYKKRYYLKVKEFRDMCKEFKAEVHLDVVQLTRYVSRHAFGCVVTHLTRLVPESHLLLQPLQNSWILKMKGKIDLW